MASTDLEPVTETSTHQREDPSTRLIPVEMVSRREAVVGPLVGRTTEELEALAQELGEPSYRGRQISQWLYRRGARSFDDMKDLPARLRDRLAEVATVGRSGLVTAQASVDGTT